jgi:hypothetical protein
VVGGLFLSLVLTAGWIGNQLDPQRMAALRTRLYDGVRKVPPVGWLLMLGVVLLAVALQEGLTRRLAPRGWSAYGIEWATAGVILAVMLVFLAVLSVLGF